jgi:hypothetical protein
MAEYAAVKTYLQDQNSPQAVSAQEVERGQKEALFAAWAAAWQQPQVQALPNVVEWFRPTPANLARYGGDDPAAIGKLLVHMAQVVTSEQTEAAGAQVTQSQLAAVRESAEREANARAFQNQPKPDMSPSLRATENASAPPPDVLRNKDKLTAWVAANPARGLAFYNDLVAGRQRQ